MGPGQEALGWVYAQGGENDVIIGMSRTNGSDTTVLTVRNENRRFDWACATLEDYDATCPETNAQPFNCTKMVLTSLNGANVTPEWQTTGQAKCDGGAIISNNGADVSIYGHDKPSK